MVEAIGLIECGWHKEILFKFVNVIIVGPWSKINEAADVLADKHTIQHEPTKVELDTTQNGNNAYTECKE